MLKPNTITAFLGMLCLGVVALAQTSPDERTWKIYIANDNCPDYTWNFTEEQTRQAFADVVKGHLDEMNRTDGEHTDNRDRYNMAVTQEAICFVERYSQREQELIRRIKEGRVYVSPYLCNSLWAFQNAEGMIRTFYPYRRLEQQWGFSTDSAHHIELPSLPWGVPTILAGCGFRNLSVPYLDYDSTFKQLQIPPLFRHAGPDGSSVRVVMDRWACSTAYYTQGASILKDPQTVAKKWIPHYAGLGDTYPLRSILACGTHGDIRPDSGQQAGDFAARIIQYNATARAPARLVNATYPQFWDAVQDAERKRPFLPTVRGSFGHSWDLWPVSLAKYVADSREGGRRLLAAETLLSVASHGSKPLDHAVLERLHRAEWCWSMLSDHAWNGTSNENKRHNADLRRRWSEELIELANGIEESGWSAKGILDDTEHVVLFNSLSIPRRELVCLPVSADVTSVSTDGQVLPCQTIEEAGQHRLCFVSPPIDGFGWKTVKLGERAGARAEQNVLVASPTQLESPDYRVSIDPRTGGIASLIHKATGTELVTTGQPHTLCEPVHFDGKNHVVSKVDTEVLSVGRVLAQLQVRTVVNDIRVANTITVYANLDRVDIDARISKPTARKEERLCHMFPLLSDQAMWRVATAGAVVRLGPQPIGDLLPGAGQNRFAVQEFINASENNVSVTVVPLDAFALRLDVGPPAFEVLGNDQNYREVTKDQHAVTDFRFRYSIRAHANAYADSDAVPFARFAATPLLHRMGRVPRPGNPLPQITMESDRVIATCLKPADNQAIGGHILRLWEIGGRSEPATIALNGYRRAILTDLLERNLQELTIVDGNIHLEMKARGYSAVRLMPSG